jgi:hypothetical protein
MTYLSPSKTKADWVAVRKKLDTKAPPSLWREVVDSFFHDRVDSRYLQPIERIQKAGALQGEGFSILTIQCALIEFLESTMQGIAYRYLRRGERLGLNEYSKSGAIFRSFLTTRLPFSDAFTHAIAGDFYVGVRCGLLHEAQTKNGWNIHARAFPRSKLIDAGNKIVFRDNFQVALRDLIKTYENAVLHNDVLRAAFIRKFDRLAAD